jgi:lipid A ethanolaminephosphotransferase
MSPSDGETMSAGRARAPILLSIALAVWLAAVGNVPLWRALWVLPGQEGVRGLVFATLLGVGIAAVLVALLSLLAWPRVFRLFALLLLLSAALSSYFMLQYGVVIDATMMANVVNTDVREVRDLLSWPLLVSLLLVAVLPGYWLMRRPVRMRPILAQAWRNLATVAAALAVAVAVILLSYQDLASLMRNHKHVRYLINPLNVLYGSGKLVAQQLPRAAAATIPVGLDATLGPSHATRQRPPVLVLVVGETARAANFSLGGYARPTNPELARLRAEGDLTYFSQVRSCGTNTQASVPCMFSHLGKEGYERSSQPHENLLDVLWRAGLQVLWLDNQSGCKGLCSRVDQALTRTLQVPGLCADGECFDEVMLHGLDQRLAALDPARVRRGVVIVMHQMGSHGPAYHRRSPAAFKKFQPECTSNTLQQCPREQVVNAYDNTLVYTDHMLASTVRWLQRQERDGKADTALLYVSDHGESLGENNLYLHGLPYALAPQEQIHVPMLAWLSPSMKERLGLRQDCLDAGAARALTHDHLFHSVLGLMDVRTAVQRKELDIFSNCR